ncbi:MAG: ribosome assembly RNA-binding protein YhbY [Proteobacteria bacterium]|nr:ribosome assembly RNA-binding protein YhbY [Pseudomonadota bacterium]RTL30551.1 MAG: ribosome assembly RNA-binding protein YhbY [Rhodocyclaceae bacterium]
MIELSPAQRRAFRAQAHHLHPVVSVAGNGLTPAVLKEIDHALQAHELIKVRVYGDDRSLRESILASICTELGAAAVQHIGKTLIVWREKREQEATRTPSTDRPKKPLAKAKSAKALSSHRGIASLKKKAGAKKDYWFATPGKGPRRQSDDS